MESFYKVLEKSLYLFFIINNEMPSSYDLNYTYIDENT